MNVKTALLVGVMFFALGLGNLIYGSYKLRAYSVVLKEALAGTPPAQLEHHTLVPAYPQKGFAARPEHLRKFESRVAFYRLVQLGGKMFLVLAGALLLYCLVALRPAP